MIVPVIEIWILQWYAKVPAWEKVWLKTAPGWRVPLSNAPPSAVTVCGALPVFVHVTFVPTGTVRVGGVKAKSTIFAVDGPAAGAEAAAGTEAAAGALAAPGAAGVVVGDAYDPEHAATIRAIGTATRAVRREMNT